VVDGERSKIARLDTEVADDVVALIVIIAARSKTYSVACAYFRQKISFIGQLEPVNKRAYRAIGGKSALAGRVLEVIGIGFKRVGAVKTKQPGNAGCVFAISGKKQALECGHRGKAAVELPRSLAEMKTANEIIIERER